ncbi:MAG: 3-oxoadipate enol-lactonase [Rhodobacteraceae bacterium]|nr:3-oxoadipate enol-lactonase [Paracoccaceae bacterium]
MQMIGLNGITMHISDQGDPSGTPIVFSNSLGTDFRLWDQIVPLLPKGLRIIRYDMRGHGLTSCPEGDYFMGDLVGDVAALLDHLQIRNCVFVGLSIGGMIAQGLAAERPDLLRAMVLSNTAAKIGTVEMWQERTAAVRAGGVSALAEPILERWFSSQFRSENKTELEGWRNMLCRTPRNGYCGCSAAISETDLFDSTARLSLPTLGIAGSEDGSTPPDVVRETVELIAGARFHLIRQAGHLPCVEKPDEFAAVVTEFLQEVGHV